MMKNIKNKKINVKRLVFIAVCLIVVGIAGELLVGFDDSRYVTLEDTANIPGVTEVHVTAKSQILLLLHLIHLQHVHLNVQVQHDKTTMFLSSHCRSFNRFRNVF